ncbi:MAG: alpha/beta hydrolase [Myxococcales bacterium]|nr:alpha/beta hydrolase [Myxococcales bacterium]
MPKLPIPARLERPLLKAVLGAPEPVLLRLAGVRARSPEGYDLDPQVATLLRMMRLAGEPELTDGSVSDARRRMERNGPLLDYTDVRGIDTHDRTIPGPTSALRVRVYRSKRGSRAGLVFFHGGGFVLGSIASHDGVCRALVELADVTVISVDYRLAPEHPFPAGLEDAEAATRWVLDNAESLGLSPTAVAVGGDSAGGNLAALVCLALARAERRPAFQLLVYPATDFRRGHASHRHFAEGFLLGERSIDLFLERYLNGRDLVRDPRVSPLLADDHTGLPPALVLTAGFDPLRDEGAAYAARLRAAGVDAHHVCAESLVHGFFNMGGMVRAADEVIRRAAARLRDALHSSPLTK